MLFVVVVVACVILTEARPQFPEPPEDIDGSPEVIVEEVAAYDNDVGPVIDADSFPLAPDVPQSSRGGVNDYHIRKLH